MNSVKGNCDEAVRKSPKKMPFLSYNRTLKSYPFTGGAGTRQAISMMSETAAHSVGTGVEALLGEERGQRYGYWRLSTGVRPSSVLTSCVASGKLLNVS